MKKLFILILLALSSGKIYAQEPPVENLLQMAEKSSEKYVESFKNLIAEETKVVEIFKKDQSSQSRRVIRSNFVVYQLQKGDHVSEFRSVFEFNGRKISMSDEAVEDFFKKLAKSDNANEEFYRVKKESLRYDGNFTVWGVTLGKDFFLLPRVRKYFNYAIIGREKFAGREVYVVEYRQKEYSPYILANAIDSEKLIRERVMQFDTVISDKFRPTNPRLNGKLWIDAENGEVWKNEYHLLLHPAILSQPVITNEGLYEYQPSKFGIAVPKRIVITSYRVFGNSEKNLALSKFAMTTLSYSGFSELNTEAKEYKSNGEKK